MPYEHGITITESETTVSVPVTTESGVQVVIGTAPIHLLDDPAGAVNKPIVVNTLDEAKAKVGYSYNFANFTLCESIYSAFELFKTSPLVLINVLDPAAHTTSVPDSTISLSKGKGTITDDGVLLNTVAVKSSDGVTTYVKDTDYTISFDYDGHPVISTTSTTTIPGNATSLKVSYTKLDSTKVTKTDIIGGYDASTGKYSGAELIRQIFPMFNLVPGIISAPGWSHIPDIAAVLDAKSRNISGNFNAHNVLDIDSNTVTKYDDVPNWKSTNNYSSEKSTVLWPKVKVGDKILWFSAVQAALMASIDAQNDDVPYVSPSNKKIPISAAVLPDGTEIYLDQTQANYLNSYGVVTAINWNGFRSWGNNTAIYPYSTDAKERFIAIRRVLDWWANTFILAYFDRVDDPTNFRLIESLVDDENLRANGFKAKGEIAGATIEFRQDMNPVKNILNGKITFIQKIGVFSPAENIENILEFDPTIVTNSLFGGGK